MRLCVQEFSGDPDTMNPSLKPDSVNLGILSERELQVARAYAHGANYVGIAETMNLSPATVRTHLRNTYRKLGVSSKVELFQAFSRELDDDKTEREREAASESQLPQRPDKPSIAVLAFENMSGDPDQEYFADGISEDIISALSRSPWLFVIARNSSFTFKGQSVEMRDVARELGVRFVLEGSVRRAGNRVRVSANLIDGENGENVWSDRYDGDIADVFDLQDDITRGVVASIQTALHLRFVEEPFENRPRPNITVWESVMRAWRLVYQFTPQSFQAGRVLIEETLEIEPDNPEAHMVMSLIEHHAAIMGFVDDKPNTHKKAYDFARRAVSLDQRNEYAHWMLGLSSWSLDRLDESVAALERAIELNPNCSLAYGTLGTILAVVGRVEEAFQNQAISIRANPRDPSMFFRYSGLALAHYVGGEYQDAVNWADQSIRRRSDWVYAWFLKIAALQALGDRQEACAVAQHCMSTIPKVAMSDLNSFPLKDKDMESTIRAQVFDAGIPG